MALYARKLQYAAGQDEAGASFIALVELARRKCSGATVGYLLYRCILQFFQPKESRVEMIRLDVRTVEEAGKKFQSACGLSKLEWQKTTGWLYPVVVGGGYEQFSLGTWVKVGRPAPRAKRRKKRPLQFGNLGCIVSARQGVLAGLKELQSDIDDACNALEEYDAESDERYIPPYHQREYEELRTEQELLNDEIARVLASIEALRAQMRAKARKMFPQPAGKTPKRVLRKKC
ncbi:hypothetical protein HYV30_03635 [Candidatus Kaiserbacteria bacterium]|nr:hypothetical protein [Candidatus Kaiserbacteria bacterium]